MEQLTPKMIAFYKSLPKRKAYKPKKISFRAFKETHDKYIRERYVFITTIEERDAKRIIVRVQRSSALTSNQIYLEKKIQETIVRDLKRAGFIFFGNMVGDGEYIKTKYKKYKE